VTVELYAHIYSHRIEINAEKHTLHDFNKWPNMYIKMWLCSNACTF